MAVARGTVFSLLSRSVVLAPSCSTRLLPACTATPHRQYAKPLGGLGRMGKGKGKLGPTVEKVRLPVESDPEKLVNFVCGSHPVKENREDVKLKDDAEYPDWLWTLRTGRLPPLQEMDPNSKEYWKKLRRMAMQNNNLMSKIHKF